MKAFNDIKAFFFDVDGVMTDGRIHVLANGEQIRSFFVKDGWAINYARKAGYIIAVISSGQYEGVRKRLEYLQIEDIHIAVKDKMEVFNGLLEKYDLKKEEVLYMGDDIPDIKILKEVGLPTCPNDAVIDVINSSKYISPYNGGQGAVRDVIEKTMRIQEKWLVD